LAEDAAGQGIPGECVRCAASRGWQVGRHGIGWYCGSPGSSAVKREARANRAHRVALRVREFRGGQNRYAEPICLIWR
jgi:hypothetical protein